jgi:hypothetical protein
MNIPHGQATGCNPRTTKYGEYCAKLEDRVEIITDDDVFLDAIARPREDTLLGCIPAGLPFSQGSVGSCAAEAGTALIQVVKAFNGQPNPKLSPWSMYCFTSGGKKDRGSSVGETLRHLREVGVLTMDTWPRSQPWKFMPSQELLDTEACNYRIDEYYDIMTIEGVMTALTLNYPVQFGWQGHSVIALALKSMTEFYYLNSWGSKWSETDMPGIGVLKFRQIDFAYEAHAARTVTVAGAA